MKNTNEKVKPMPLDKLLGKLCFKMEVESICKMHSSDHLKILASTIYYLEKLKELKNGKALVVREKDRS